MILLDNSNFGMRWHGCSPSEKCRQRTNLTPSDRAKLNTMPQRLGLKNNCREFPIRSANRETTLSSKHALINQYCVSCHNAEEEKGDLILEGISLQNPAENPELWEKVVKRLESRQMPPADRKRPNEASYDAVIASLTDTLDAHAAVNQSPGRVDTFRRLEPNRICEFHTRSSWSRDRCGSCCRKIRRVMGSIT